MALVLHKELEYKVEKLKYRKFYGIIYYHYRGSTV